jgi:hypothetical protein
VRTASSGAAAGSGGRPRSSSCSDSQRLIRPKRVANVGANKDGDRSTTVVDPAVGITRAGIAQPGRDGS